MSKKRKIEAKLFPFEARKRLFEMAKKYGKRKFTLIAVWTYMFTRSGNGNVFELAESAILWDLGMTHEPLWEAQKILMAEGFLAKEKRAVKEVTRWTVLAGGKSADKESQQADNPPADIPTVGKSASGKSANTVEVHEQDADASTSDSTPSASTPSASVGLLASKLTDSADASSSQLLDQKQEQNLSGLEAKKEQPQNQNPWDNLGSFDDWTPAQQAVAFADELWQAFGIPYSSDNPRAKEAIWKIAESGESRLPWFIALAKWCVAHPFWKKRIFSPWHMMRQLEKHDIVNPHGLWCQFEKDTRLKVAKAR